MAKIHDILGFAEYEAKEISRSPQDWMKYLENGEYLRAAEVSEEQNYNMIDGRNNNRVAKKEEKTTDEKPSLLGRLKEKQEQLSSGVKKDAPAQNKKSERDMQ